MIRNQRGQITVFLSLLFLVLLGVSLGILEGVRSYENSSLAEEALLDAGEEVLAYYDRSLFERYHLFFLDPRERNYLSADGKRYINQYFTGQSFYGFSCSDLDITEEKTAVDEKGLFLKHEIREWMKYQESAKLGNSLKQLIRAVSGMDNQAHTEAGKFQRIEDKETSSQKMDSASEGNQRDSEKDPEKDSVSPEISDRMNWRQLKETLNQLLQSGVLFYAVDDPGTLSSSAISAENLPSKEQNSNHISLREWGEGLSFVQLSEWRTLLESAQDSIPKISDLTEKAYLLEYLMDCFSYYEDESNQNNQSRNTVLQYELEYLIGGKVSDQKNLRLVADRILMLRFLENYFYASRDAGIQIKAGSMATVLTGVMGFPQGQKAVSMLLTATLSYGESLLELHALFSGKSIAIWKDASTWNMTFENGGRLLQTRSDVKRGKYSADYETFLRLLLLLYSSEDELFYRMMDIMQLNVALDEPGFRMKDCLFSFRWKAEMQFDRWFTFLPGLQMKQSRTIPLQFEKNVSY